MGPEKTPPPFTREVRVRPSDAKRGQAGQDFFDLLLPGDFGESSARDGPWYEVCQDLLAEKSDD